MSLFSSRLSSTKLAFVNAKTAASLIAFLVLSLSTLLSSEDAIASSCSKSDIDYYLQRGFTNAQVVQLCAGTASNQTTGQQTYQAPSQQTQQNSQIREDQSYLSAALDAENVTLTSQALTLFPRECIEYGPSSGSRASVDLVETICVNTKLTLNFAGMTVNKASKGLFLVKDATITVKGKIQREFVGISALRRQDQEAVRETLKSNPTELKIKIRRGIEPSSIATRLKNYTR